MLLYGAEIWTITKREGSKIQGVEIKFLRAIRKKTKKDRVRDINIRWKLEIVQVKKAFKTAA